MPADLMIDLSSNNPIPDLKKHWAAGYRTIALKATESTTYTWTKGLDLADQWHALGAGAVVWFYHFARPGDPKAEAKHFLAAIKGHVKKQDRLVCDAEVSGVNDAFVHSFFDYVHAHRPNKEEIYSYGSFLTSNHIKPHHEEGLWLASYSAGSPAVPAGWKSWDAWQYTDKAKVPGESAPVDQSHLSKTGEPSAPKPKRRRRPFASTVRRLLRLLRRNPNKISPANRRLLRRLVRAIRRHK